MKEKANAYARAGVDVEMEAEASRMLYEASKKTYKNRKGKFGEVLAPFDDFAALKMISVGKLPAGSFMSVGFDTAGTKVEIAQRVGKHDTMAFDLLAMVCDDAVVRGGEPILVGSNLDITSLGSDKRLLPVVRQLAKGYIAAAKEAGVAIINGEIAQMGSLVSGHGVMPYHWGAACVWVARKNKLFTGLEIRKGDAIVVLREHGFRTNGLSLARSIFKKAYGERWHAKKFGRSTIGLQALEPAKIFSRFVVGLHGGFDSEGLCEIHGVAHITGGGVPEKIGRVLHRSGYGVRLTDLFEPPAIVQACQMLGGVSDRDAYRAWNMGQGMAVITPQPEKVVAGARKFGIEARIAGEVVARPGVSLLSRGAQKPGAELAFD